jgi:hypothetical protein
MDENVVPPLPTPGLRLLTQQLSDGPIHILSPVSDPGVQAMRLRYRSLLLSQPHPDEAP